MYTISSFFAGVGGIDMGFEQTKQYRTIYANEIDNYARETMMCNFNIEVDKRDIRDVQPDDVPDTDIIVGGFPCQAFSIAGLQEGFNDKKGRGELFFELMRIIAAKQPRAILFENVKNLIHHDDGHTFEVISNTLKRAGYCYTYRVLNAKEYGNLPQNRERVYIVAFREAEDYIHFAWPDPIPLTRTVKDIIDFSSQVDERYYYRKGKYKGEIFEKLEKAMAHDDSRSPGIYQWRRKYVRKNQSNVIPTLTANQGQGGHNVCLIKTQHGIRKMTPRECFNAQGFPPSFVLPPQSHSRLYKQAGNSVCVPVVERIAEKMCEAMNRNNSVLVQA